MSALSLISNIKDTVKSIITIERKPVATTGSTFESPILAKIVARAAKRASRRAYMNQVRSLIATFTMELHLKIVIVLKDEMYAALFAKNKST